MWYIEVMFAQDVVATFGAGGNAQKGVDLWKSLYTLHVEKSASESRLQVRYKLVLWKSDLEVIESFGAHGYHRGKF